MQVASLSCPACTSLPLDFKHNSIKSVLFALLECKGLFNIKSCQQSLPSNLIQRNKSLLVWLLSSEERGGDAGGRSQAGELFSEPFGLRCLTLFFQVGDKQPMILKWRILSATNDLDRVSAVALPKLPISLTNTDLKVANDTKFFPGLGKESLFSFS